MIEEIEEIKLLRFFSTNLDSNLNLNKEQVKNIIEYITNLEKNYSTSIEILDRLGETYERWLG